MGYFWAGICIGSALVVAVGAFIVHKSLNDDDEWNGAA